MTSKHTRLKSREKKRTHARTSPHIFATERWVVQPPNKPAQAYLSEARAMNVARAIAGKGEAVTVAQERLVNGEWVEVEE